MNHDVILQEITQKDIELIRNWRNKEDIRNNFLNSNEISSTQQEAWFRKYVKQENDRMFLILSEKLNNKPVGTVALYNIDFLKKEAEFGRLMIGEADAKGLGIGFLATKQMCEYGFEKLNLSRIYLQVFQENVVAKNIYEKIGFTILKTELINDYLVEFMVLEKR